MRATLDGRQRVFSDDSATFLLGFFDQSGLELLSSLAFSLHTGLPSLQTKGALFQLLSTPCC